VPPIADPLAVDDVLFDEIVQNAEQWLRSAASVSA
jgi:hypothetical protein